MATLKGSNVKKLLDYLGPVPPMSPTPGEEPDDEEEDGSQDDVPKPAEPVGSASAKKRKKLKDSM